MIGPDQDLSEFPPWVWKYIDIARLARNEATSGELRGTETATPTFATAARLGALVAAATVKQIAGKLKDPKLSSELGAAAAAVLSADIDDICPSRTPWPHPPRHLELLELAGQVAIAAAAIGDKTLSGDLGKVAGRLVELSSKQT